MSVSRGAISQINGGTNPTEPLLQVSSLTYLGGRAKLTLTDGVGTITAMLAQQCNAFVEDNSCKVNTIVRITAYTVNNMGGAMVAVITGLDVVEQMDEPISANAAPPAAYTSQAPKTPQPFAPYSSLATSGGSGYKGEANEQPVLKNTSNMNIVPIESMNPYSNKWTIKARITSRSEIRRWSNAKGEGHLFSVDLLDAHGGEIRGTFFKETADKFMFLREGGVYTFCGGSLKLVQNKQFNPLKNNYEVTFNNSSEIHEVGDDDGAIKTQSYEFVKVSDISNVEVNANIDILAIVKSASDVTEIVSSKMGGKTLQKRELTLMDDSLSEIRLTLWGEKATAQHDWNSQPIVACKNVRVGDYGGRSLGAINNTSLVLNPPMAEAEALYNWRVSQGDRLPETASLSNAAMGGGGGAAPLERRKDLCAIKDENLGCGEKPDYMSFKGTVSKLFYEKDIWYTACPTPDCNKKVTESMGGSGYHCEKCDRTFDTCIRRYNMRIQMCDHTSGAYVSLFNDTAEKLIGETADNLYTVKAAGDEAQFESSVKKCLWKAFTCKVRVKQETNQEKEYMKLNMMNLDPVDLVAESAQMLSAIAKYQ